MGDDDVMRARDHGRLSNSDSSTTTSRRRGGLEGGLKFEGVRVVVYTHWLISCRLSCREYSRVMGCYGARARARATTRRGRLNESLGCQKDENIPCAMWILVLCFVFAWSTLMGVRCSFGSFDGLLLSGCFVMGSAVVNFDFVSAS